MFVTETYRSEPRRGDMIRVRMHWLKRSLMQLLAIDYNELGMISLSHEGRRIRKRKGPNWHGCGLTFIDIETWSNNALFRELAESEPDFWL